MARLNIEKQNELEPKRFLFAKNILIHLGYEITKESSTELNFIFKGEVIKLFPYSGWHQGKGIVPGRGIEKLIKQIT